MHCLVNFGNARRLSLFCLMRQNKIHGFTWTDQDWIGLIIFKNFADQDWIGFNFCGSGLQLWSLKSWSRSRDSSRDPFFEVSVSRVSGLVSVSKDFGLELFVSRLCIGYFFMKLCKKEFL